MSTDPLLAEIAALEGIDLSDPVAAEKLNRELVQMRKEVEARMAEEARLAAMTPQGRRIALWHKQRREEAFAAMPPRQSDEQPRPWEPDWKPAPPEPPKPPSSNLTPEQLEHRRAIHRKSDRKRYRETHPLLRKSKTGQVRQWGDHPKPWEQPIDKDALRRLAIEEAAKMGFDITKPGELERMAKAAEAQERAAAREERRVERREQQGMRIVDAGPVRPPWLDPKS